MASAAALTLAMPAGSFARELKIGYVNLTKVMEEAPQGVLAQKKLESEFRPRDQELVAMQSRIQKLEEEIARGEQKISETEIRKHERELLTLKRQLKRSTQEFREDHNQRRNEELLALQQVVQKAIADMARQEKYDLIVYEGALYASEAIDVTEKVLKRLGKQ